MAGSSWTSDAADTIQDIERSVILMQDNRSFKHCCGMPEGVLGFPIPLPSVEAGFRVLSG